MPYIGAGIQRFNTADGLTVNGNAEVTGTSALTGAATLTAGFTASDGCTITTADNSSQLTLVSTDADGSSGPHLVLQRDSSSPADNDLLGQIIFRGEDDGSNVVEACEMKVTARDVTNGTEDSQFDITTQVAGTARSRMVMNEVETVFNQDSVDLDFRVESNGNANMLFVDGGNDRIGIGTASPDGSSFSSSSSPVVDVSGTRPLIILSETDSNTKKVWLALNSDAFYLGGTNTDTRFYTDNSERMRIDSSGNVSINTTSTTDPLRIDKTGSNGTVIRIDDDGTETGIFGVVANQLYIASPFGADAGLRWGSNKIEPCTAAGADRDNQIDLGGSSVRFDDIRATNGTIQTSDQNEKEQIASLTTAEMTAAKAISKLFKTFKWKDKVAAKGDAARTHAGVIAQEVQTAMTDAGLTAADYAFWCSDTWWESNGQTYETADDAPEGATQRTRLGIRYAELLAFIGAATEQRLADLETRVTALEDA